jgi:Protein of unknown function (DUF1553)/Protein of unknown function (DUF1549)
MANKRALFLSVFLAGTAFAQTPGPGDPNGAADNVDRAHRPLFQPPPDKAKSASEITAEVRKSAEAAARQPTIARRNYIDQAIFGRMERDGIPHAPLVPDSEFVRRVFLDATGRVPSPDDVLSFLGSRNPEKRDALIDRLVNSEAFVDRWTYYFEDLFRAGGRMGSGLNLFHYWVREWLKLDRPYNEVVTDLLTGGGKTSYSVPGAMYFARDFVKAKDDPEAPDAQDLVNIPDTVDEFTVTYSKVFLGINLACISCHNGAHHLEKVNLFLTGKTREQFFQQAAFFGRTRQIMNWENGYQANTEYTVDDVAKGYDTKAESIVRIPRSGGSGEPHFILTGEAPRQGMNQRDELARMLTQNPQFARAFVNRIWAEFMGFGIVEPVDDFDLARCDPRNPPPAPWTLQPNNPELLDALARDFQQNRYSFKHLVKTILKSNAYQLSSRFDGEWKESYAPYYARKFVRMLSAAELHDAITTVTARPSDGKGPGAASMVMEMPDPKKAGAEASNFMRVFGQSNRDDMPKKTPPSSLQAMLLMQSRLVTERVRAGDHSRVELLLESAKDDRSLIESIYISTVSRKPTDSEIAVAAKGLAPDRRRGAENLQWALINSPEFIFSY